MSTIINPPPHVYCGIGIDRASERRRDETWLQERRRDPRTRTVVMQGLNVLVEDRPDGPRACLPSLGRLGIELDERATLLGLVEGRALFAVDLGGMEIDDASYVDLRSVGPALPAEEAGLLALARAMAHWHVRHRYCGACGSLSRVIDAGYARRCDSCGLDTFPRTDPAVIMLVTAGDQCVLGRSPRFRPGMYSTLAGFVEPGESLEQAVAREIHEEVGIRIDRAIYRSSQPWPFPQSLMLGFRAHAVWQELRCDPTEIEDARWFSRAELRDPERRPVELPNGDSIARYLVEEWLAED